MQEMTNEEFFRSLNYENGEEVIEKIFRRFPMQYGTTLGRDGEPQIRPLEFKFMEGGKFYFDTVDTYESFLEMKAHPFIRICIGDQESMSYVTVRGHVTFTRDPGIIHRCFENSKVLTEQFGDHPEKVVAYYLDDMRATFATFLPGLSGRQYVFGASRRMQEERVF